MKSMGRITWLVAVTVFCSTLCSITARALTLAENTVVLESYVAEEQRNYSIAIGKLMPLLKTSPNDYFLNLRLGWLFFQSQKYKNAINHYEAAAKVEPASVEPGLGLSAVLMTISDYPEAIAACKEILRRDPLNYMGRQRLIKAYLGQKDFANAAREAEAALKTYPTDAIFLEQRGYALTQSGQTDQARQVLATLLLVNPKNPYARSILGAP